MINNLVEIINEAELQLLISSNIITWEVYKYISIINLIFIFSWLIQYLMSCRTDSEVENNFNYYLIILLFTLNTILQVQKK
jgi:hypothetical protein